MWKWQTTVLFFLMAKCRTTFQLCLFLPYSRSLFLCLLYLPERVHLVMWLLTKRFVSPDLWWQMIDHESLKPVWLKWVWGEEGLLRPGPWSGKMESVHPSTSLPLGRSTDIWEGCALSSGPQSRHCPSLTWPSCLPPAHFGVVNSCLLLDIFLTPQTKMHTF